MQQFIFNNLINFEEKERKWIKIAFKCLKKRKINIAKYNFVKKKKKKKKTFACLNIMSRTQLHKMSQTTLYLIFFIRMAIKIDLARRNLAKL